MLKYQRKIQSGGVDSLSIVAGEITPGSLVLDVGFGAGALGEYLAREKNCIVDGVDKFNYANEHIKKVYRETFYLDLENPDWVTHLNGKNYDFIVLADVLEHLSEPDAMLKSVAQLLNPRGKVLLSVPNVSHIGVVSSLLNGRFEYKEEGLLDKTHIKFFTRSSLQHMLERNGYEISYLYPLRKKLSDSEFREYYLDMQPPSVVRSLLSQPDALTYQFIVTAKFRPKKSETETIEENNFDEYVNNLYFGSELFFRGDGENFQAKNSINGSGIIGLERQIVSFIFPSTDKKIHSLRVDFSDRPGLIHIFSLNIFNHDGDLLWSSPINCEYLNSLNKRALNFIEVNSVTQALISEDDNWIELNIDPTILSQISKGARFDIELSWPMTSDLMKLLENNKFDDLNNKHQTLSNEEIIRVNSSLNLGIFAKKVVRKIGYIAYKILATTARFLKLTSFARKLFEKSLLPKDFDELEYLRLNPDVLQAKVNPSMHYLLFGKKEGRHCQVKKFIQKFCANYDLLDLDRRKKTILLVSHEATMTGAPMLTLFLAKALSSKYNVVVFLLRDGVLLEELKDSGISSLVVSEVRGNALLASQIIDFLFQKFNFDFSICNSIESSVHVLPGLTRNNILALSLVHEFAETYAKPREVFKLLLNNPGEIVFSSKLLKKSALKYVPELIERSLHVVPQGFGGNGLVREIQDPQEAQFFRNQIRPQNCSAKLILGMGSLHYRKGVDLFIQCAKRVKELDPEFEYRFVWVGKSYDEDIDLGYHGFLKDQICRSGLSDCLFLVNESSYYEIAYQEADLFLITSRLDPLPNVGIDAIANGVPVLCFEGSTGMAEYLIEAGVGDECVSKYLDVESMASKIIALFNNIDLKNNVQEKIQGLVSNLFDMPRYVSNLESIVINASKQKDHQKNVILNSKEFDMQYFSHDTNKHYDLESSIADYMQSWQTHMFRRKPRPGFHPGIYLENNEKISHGSEPFAIYLERNRPKGPWANCVITPHNAELLDFSSKLTAPKIALHIHAHYVDLLPKIMSRLGINDFLPDLYVSTSSQGNIGLINSLLDSYAGKVCDIRLVPNVGRDIGPLLTAFGKTICEEYDIVGHIHTKKSAHVESEIGEKWFHFMLGNLLGGPEGGAMGDNIINFLAKNPNVGLVFPDDPNICGWDKNLADARALLDSMGYKDLVLPTYFNFPIGTMFWARTKILEPLIELDLGWGNYPPEPLPIDGTILHAIERIFPFINSAQGFEYALTYVPGVIR